jgi:curved DNA-binding protein CbpA
MGTTDPRHAPDLYALLRVRPTVDDASLTTAYRRLARRYHPDIDPHPRALRRMIAINHAYAVLRDPGRRAAYDRSLRTDAGEGPWHTDGPDVPGSVGVDGAHPDGVRLPLGRYEGWSLTRVARVDRPYLEWLERMPAGRRYRDAITAALGR